MPKKRIAIFASGSGSNAEKLVHHFSNHSSAEVVLLLCNKPKAGVVAKMHALEVPVLIFNRKQLQQTLWLQNLLLGQEIDLIVLAGFLWKVPNSILETAIPIYNIHPSLLPKYGGLGMYGMRVHEAVIKAGEKESGITIHKVTEHYDEGAVVFQARINLDSQETPQSLASKIQILEHQYLPKIIEQVLINAPNLSNKL